MVEHNIRRYTCTILYSFLAICFITYCGYRVIQGENINLWNIITTSMSATALLVTSFVIWAWRWKIFQGWLVPFPNLNGKWKGNIKYAFEGKESTRKIDVTIKQTFISIIVKFNTKESHSINFCGSFNIDDKRDIKQLIYSYQNEPEANFRDKSPVHFGTTRLDINHDCTSMSGEYWTSRKTTGAISLKKHKK